LFFTPIHATCPAHQILLNLITQIISGNKCKSWSSSLCSFLHSLATSYLLRPNVFLGTFLSKHPYILPSLRQNNMQMHCVNKPQCSNVKAGGIYIVTTVLWRVNRAATLCIADAYGETDATLRVGAPTANAWPATCRHSYWTYWHVQLNISLHISRLAASWAVPKRVAI
jgi:hypothetical protein